MVLYKHREVHKINQSMGVIKMFKNETELGRHFENGMVTIIYGCLRKLGNQEPYFSVTHITTKATKKHTIDKRYHWESCGACMSKEEDMFPQLKDIFDLHLKTYDNENDYHKNVVWKYDLNIICH